MLIRKEKIDNSIIWGIWKISETVEELLLNLNDINFSKNISSSKRLLESAATRVLLKTLLNEEGKKIDYTPSGKPFLCDNSFFISITHTQGYAAIILSKKKEVGIDIEFISDKVNRVRPKFISYYEYIDPNNENIHLLLHWSAKETVFKALDASGIDFKRHLRVQSFQPKNEGTFILKETFTIQQTEYMVKYFIANDYVLTLTY